MTIPSGKVLDSDNFTTDAGWTVTTDAGSYAVSGGKGNFTAATGGLNSLGFVRTTGTVSQPFTKYSMDFNAPTGTNHNFMLLLSTSATFGFSGRFGAYINGGGVLYVYDAGAVDIGFGSITNATYNVAIVIWPNYTVKLYIDGVFQYQSVNFSGALITDELLYWQVHVDKCNGNGVLQVDNFLVTDQAQAQYERSEDGVIFTPVSQVDLGVEAASDSLLTPGTQYYYQVQTNRGGDLSPYSSIAHATTGGGSGDAEAQDAFIVLPLC